MSCRRAGSAAASVVLMVWMVSCLKPSLPPLPTISTEGFSPSIRAQFDKELENLRAAPEDAERNGRMGMLLHAYDRLEPAGICYRRAHLLQPKDYRWLYYLGVIHASSSRPRDAIAAFRQTLEQKPEDLAARIALADALLASGEHAAARTIYEKVATERPDYAIALYGAGKAHEAGGNLAEAESYFLRACERYPAYAAAHYALGLVQRKLGRAEEASAHLAIYERNRTGAPPREDPLLAAVHTLGGGVLPLLAQAKKLAAAGQVREALELHLRVLEAEPNQEQAHINLISLYGRLGEFAKAEEHYRAAIALNPNRDEAHYNFAVMGASQGRVKEAMAAYRKALEINPLNAEAHNNLGYLLAQRGQLDEALEHQKKALENKPGYPQAHFNAGTILLKRGRPGEAIPHFEALTSTDDENLPHYLHALATAHASAGHRENALLYAKKARDGAASRGQQSLVERIERDIRRMEAAAPVR